MSVLLEMVGVSTSAKTLAAPFTASVQMAQLSIPMAEHAATQVRTVRVNTLYGGCGCL